MKSDLLAAFGWAFDLTVRVFAVGLGFRATSGLSFSGLSVSGLFSLSSSFLSSSSTITTGSAGPADPSSSGAAAEAAARPLSSSSSEEVLRFSRTLLWLSSLEFKISV